MIVTPAVRGTGESVLLVAEVLHPPVRVAVAVIRRDERTGLVVDLLLGPGGSAVGRDLDEAEVPVLLDDVVVPHREGRAGGNVVDRALQLRVRPVLIGVRVPHLGSAVRLGECDPLVRQVDLDAVLRALGGTGGLADLDGLGAVARVDLQRVDPSEHPLVPDAHVGRHRLEDRTGVRAGAHQIPEVDVGVARVRGVVQIRKTQVVAVLVGEHADAGVLRLDDVVLDLEVGAGDRGSARDVGRVRPDRVGAFLAAATGLVLAGVHEHDVVDDAVGLVDVAVAVAVALILDVVIGPGEVRVLLRERRHRVDRQLAGAEGVVGVALHVLHGSGLVLARRGVEVADRGAVVPLGVRDLDPGRRLAGERVGAARHLLVHLLHRVTGDVEAGLAVQARQICADPLGDALIGEEHPVVEVAREVRDPHGVVVLVGRARGIRDVVVQRRPLHVARLAVRRPETGRHLQARKVLRPVELDEDGQELRLLRAVGVLEVLRALAGLHRLGLGLGQLLCRDRVALRVLLVVLLGALERRVADRLPRARAAPEVGDRLVVGRVGERLGPRSHVVDVVIAGTALARGAPRGGGGTRAGHLGARWRCTRRRRTRWHGPERRHPCGGEHEHRSRRRSTSSYAGALL